MNHNKKKLSQDERKLYWFSGGVIAFFVVSTVVWQWLNATPQIDIPAPKMPEPNGYDFFIAAGEAYVPPNPPIAFTPSEAMQFGPESSEPPPGSPKLYSTAEKEAWLRRNVKSLSLLREGLQYHAQIHPTHSLGYSFPYTSDFRKLCRVLIVESRAKAERNDWQGAAKSALEGIEFGHKISHGGTVIANQNGFGIQSMCLHELRQLMPHLDTPTSRQTAARIEQIQAERFTLADALQKEKRTTQAALLDVMKQDNWLTALAQELYGESSMTVSPFLNLKIRFTSKKTLLTNYTNFMDAQIAMAQRPYAQHQPVPAPDDLITDSLGPEFLRINWQWARADANRLSVATMLALHAFKLENDHYPEKLTELTPEYLKRVPIDPFGSGEPLRYRLENQKYTLWSIGPDGIDNLGKPIVDLSIPTEEGERFRYMVQSNSKGDVVADVNFP